MKSQQQPGATSIRQRHPGAACSSQQQSIGTPRNGIERLGPHHKESEAPVMLSITIRVVG